MEVILPGAGKRTDADIASSARDALLYMTYVPQDAIKVLVEKGQVTLSGEVGWEYQRRAASSGVRGLMGVTAVIDLITIKQSASSNAVKSEIEAALKRRAQRDSDNISVEVQGSDVTLRGTVHSFSERDLATSCAWGSAGVRNVVDHITVSAH